MSPREVYVWASQFPDERVPIVHLDFFPSFNGIASRSGPIYEMCHRFREAVKAGRGPVYKIPQRSLGSQAPGKRVIKPNEILELTG